MIHRRAWAFAAVAAAVVIAGAPAQEQKREGYTDTPVIPGQKWRVHDSERPAARVVTPGKAYGAPPSDAVVLFDGHDLSKWKQFPTGELSEWKIRKGYVESAPKTGDLQTRDKFGDFQLHVEWSIPDLRGTGQMRGNSGVFIHNRYEIQILDSYENPTYADGQSSALYGQWPPLVNASRKPGDWQTFDIVFHAARFSDGKLTAPATVTVFQNGVLTHEKKELAGPTMHRQVPAPETPYDGVGPIRLQDHGTTMRFRNIWLRPLTDYDTP